VAENPQQRLTPKKYGLTVGGGSLMGTGSCLLWTIILIPLGLPLMFIGFVMMIASRFVKTETITCPACHSASTSREDCQRDYVPALQLRDSAWRAVMDAYHLRK
jgi:hypothetical protein